MVMQEVLAQIDKLVEERKLIPYHVPKGAILTVDSAGPLTDPRNFLTKRWHSPLKMS